MLMFYSVQTTNLAFVGKKKMRPIVKSYNIVSDTKYHKRCSAINSWGRLNGEHNNNVNNYTWVVCG